MNFVETDFLLATSFEAIRSNLVHQVKICAFIGDIDNGVPTNIRINSGRKLVRVPCLLSDTIETEIHKNDLVKLQGQFLLREIVDNKTEVCFHVKSCCVIRSFSDPQKFLKNFAQMKKLRLDKLTKQIRSVPLKTYYRIAAISFGIEDNSQYILEFTRLFQEKCTGYLYTYRADPINVNTSVIAGLDLFCNYYEIDLIVICPTDSTAETAMMLSSREILSHLYRLQQNRKRIPYLIGLDVSPDTRENSMFHVYRELCSATYSLPKCIEFIQSTQTKMIDDIETYTEWGLSHLNKQVEELKDSLLELELRFASMGFTPKDNSTVFEKTQEALITHLTVCVEALDKIQLDLTTNLLEDVHVQGVLSTLME